jgi:hypothetical protein
MAAIKEFEQQDWMQQLTGGGSKTNGMAKQHVDPNVAFPFNHDFSVGTIHGVNATKPPTTEANELVEINDNKDNVSILTTKTRVDNQPKVVVGSRAAPGSNLLIGPAAAPKDTETASEGSSDPASSGPVGGAAGGPVGK